MNHSSWETLPVLDTVISTIRAKPISTPLASSLSIPSARLNSIVKPTISTKTVKGGANQIGRELKTLIPPKLAAVLRLIS